MAKNKRAISTIGLIVALIIVPLVVMALMGFDKYDANELQIIGAAIVADVVVYFAYKLLLPKWFSRID